jgi:transcriptional regulator with XRE-family HTH domain
MSVGKIIKKRRKELKMSADELGIKLGKDRSTIYRYENGDIEKLPIDILKPIAEALLTTPEYLMGWEEPDNLSPSVKTQILPIKTRKIPILGEIA